MNKKGMTLIEVLVSITILSTASLMLFAGFRSVLHFMGKSSEIKNASNTMISYLEGTDDGVLHQDVIKAIKSTEPTYTINYKDTQIEVENILDVYRTKGVDDIFLKQLLTKKNLLLKEYPIYKSSIISANDLKKNIDKVNETFCQDKNGNFCEDFGYNSILKRFWMDIYNQQYPAFNKELLPNALSVANRTYYLRPYFPWEEFSGRNPAVGAGGVLQFLSLYNSDYRAQIETINIIYDTKQNRWYYHQGGGMTINTDNAMFYTGENSNLCIYGNCKLVRNMDELLGYIKKNIDNTWYFLDGDLPYEGGSIEKYWKPVIPAT